MWRWQLKTCWSLLTDLIDVPTQNLLRLALLLMLMMKIVLATVCCILGSWGLVIKPNFCSDFQHKVSSRFWSWSSGRILKLEFGQYFAADVLQRLWRWILVKMLKQGLVNILNFKFSRSGDVWCGFWSECLIDILKMKFEQDLCLNLWYDLKKLFWWDELKPRVRCAFGNVFSIQPPGLIYSCSGTWCTHALCKISASGSGIALVR